MVCLFIISCDKDEKPTMVEVDTMDQTDMDDPVEDTTESTNNTNNMDNTSDTEPTVSLAAIETGVSIDGANKIEGMPPAPNGVLDFQMETDNHSGYLSTGFLLEFSSENEPKGAYVLFKDENGNNATSYFDVPLNVMDGKTGSHKNRAKDKFSSISSKKIVEEEILVAFNAQVPVGKFCYDICLYDASNNVSQVITRCVEIENWGGSSEFVGEWIFDRDTEDGVDSSYINKINCANGGVIEVHDRDYREELFVLEEGGDYYETYTDYVDEDASRQSCQIVAINEADYEIDKFLGKWTYSSSTNKFSVVDFAYEFFPDATENEVYDSGEIYIDEVDIAIFNGELVLSDTFEGVVFQRIFKRKE